MANQSALLALKALLRGEPMPIIDRSANIAVIQTSNSNYPKGWEPENAEEAKLVIPSPPIAYQLENNGVAVAVAEALVEPVAVAIDAADILFPKEAPRIEGQRKYVPRKYQIEAIKRLKELERALLWDAPGMGKTVEASEAAVDRLPCLISCPNYLTEQWFQFLCEQYPEQKICIVEGTRIEREKALSQRYDWYILNHEMFRSYEMPKWINTLIVDEAHHFRNREAKQSKALKVYARPIPQIFLLTATPLYKIPPDVWHLLSILAPEEYTGYWKFVEKHCRTYANNYGVKILGVRNSAALYQEMASHGIGRTYKEVELELPQLITRNVAVTPDAAFMKKYNEVRSRFRYNDKDVNSLMEAMHIMRRMTIEPKLAYALELIQDEAEGIIFTWYTDTARALAGLLEVPCIDGNVPATDRGKIVRENKLVVGTMAAMSEGVDASHINHALFFESDYVPARMYQALSRVRRHRESAAPVRCTYLYCRGTIDEIVLHAAQTRNATIKSVMKQALMGDD